MEILVVEDDPDIRTLVTNVLLDEGYHVAAVANGEEAMHFLHTHPSPTLIITDRRMPSSTGDELIEHMLHFRSLERRVGVIVMSAYLPQPDETITRYIEHFNGVFIAKPFTIDQLLAAVSRAQEHLAQRDERPTHPTGSS